MFQADLCLEPPAFGPDHPEVIPGAIVEDTVVPAREPWSRVLAQGQMLRLIDLEGKQAVDFLCYNADDPEDRYCAADTMKIGGSIFLSTGTVPLQRPLPGAVHHRRR